MSELSQTGKISAMEVGVIGERPGGDFGWCRYVKIVDSEENTVSFIQEIYDDDGYSLKSIKSIQSIPAIVTY